MDRNLIQQKFNNSWVLSREPDVIEEYGDLWYALSKAGLEITHPASRYKTLAFLEGENDGQNYYWILVAGGSKYLLVGGCDYTGWDCQSDAAAYKFYNLDQLEKLFEFLEIYGGWLGTEKYHRIVIDYKEVPYSYERYGQTVQSTQPQYTWGEIDTLEDLLNQVETGNVRKTWYKTYKNKMNLV